MNSFFTEALRTEVAATLRITRVLSQAKTAALSAAAGLAIGTLIVLVRSMPLSPTIGFIDEAGAAWIRSSKCQGFSSGPAASSSAAQVIRRRYKDPAACKKADTHHFRMLVRHVDDRDQVDSGERVVANHVIAAESTGDAKPTFVSNQTGTRMTSLSSTGTIEAVSSEEFHATVERIAAEIQRSGLAVFGRIDHSAAARESGLQMPPTMVLIYGHAKGGTPIMLAAPNAALQLPLRVLVREEPGGQVVVSFEPIGPLLRPLGVPTELLDRLEPAQRLILDAVKLKSRWDERK